MIYLDTSVALAYLFAEDRSPGESLWEESLISSRLLEYELWNRVHARNFAPTHGEDVRKLLDRIALVELSPNVLSRAMEPFPIPVRTLDALHLASVEFLRSQKQVVRLATYDIRMTRAARHLKIPLYRL